MWIVKLWAVRLVPSSRIPTTKICNRLYGRIGQSLLSSSRIPPMKAETQRPYLYFSPRASILTKRLGARNAIWLKTIIPISLFPKQNISQSTRSLARNKQNIRERTNIAFKGQQYTEKANQKNSNLQISSNRLRQRLTTRYKKQTHPEHNPHPYLHETAIITQI